MIKPVISASIMCADFLHLAKDIQMLEECGIELLHFDIMDGVFVPNLMLNNELMKCIRTVTRIPFDVHLMIINPEDKIKWFSLAPQDIVSVHYESTPHIQRAIYEVKNAGARVAIAINPATPVEAIKNFLPDIDMALIMTVNPGYAGQQLIVQCLDKIKETRQLLDDAGYENIRVQADGNCSFENCILMRAAGADCFVAGTSSLFSKDMQKSDAIRKLREAIQ